MANSSSLRPIIWWVGYLVCFTIHFVLMVAGSFERSADGWIHLFFGEHYYLRWFDHWEPRWHHGFSLFSYPPLAHQLIAVFRFVFPPAVVGVIVMQLALIFLSSGLYRYARIWFKSEICHLMVLLILSSSVLSIAVHTFGQLPNLLALAFLFHAFACVSEWLERGGSCLLLGLNLSLCAILTSLYAGVFGFLLLGIPILIRNIKVPNLWKRLVLFIVLGFPLGIIALSPFLYFETYLAAQDPVLVYHSSQGKVMNFRAFNWYMFYGQYIGAIAFLPFLILSYKAKRFWMCMSISLGVMLVLSTSQSMLIAPILLGSLFYMINLDRFAQWSAFLLFAPISFAISQSSRKILSVMAILMGVSIHLFGTYYSASTAWRKPLPPLLNLIPIVNFLDKHTEYRYITLGLHRANQAKLSALTQASNLDGNFPFGRNFEPANRSGVASVDMARKYGPKGMNLLRHYLRQAELYHLKYIILRDPRYKTMLYDHGWKPLVRHHELMIWSNERITPIKSETRVDVPWFLNLIWGIFPMFFLSLSCFLGAFKYFSFSRNEERLF